MVIKISTIPLHLQKHIAEQMQMKDFVTFCGSSKHSRDLGKHAKPTLDVYSMNIHPSDVKVNQRLGFWLSYAKQQPGCPRFSTSRFKCDVENFKNKISLYMIGEYEQGCISGADAEFNFNMIKNSKNKHLFNRFLEVMNIDVINCEQMDSSFLKMPAMQKMKAIAITNLDGDSLDAVQLLSFKATRISATAKFGDINIRLNEFFMQWARQEREISKLYLKNLSSPFNEKAIVANLSMSILLHGEANETDTIYVLKNQADSIIFVHVSQNEIEVHDSKKGILDDVDEYEFEWFVKILNDVECDYIDPSFLELPLMYELGLRMAAPCVDNVESNNTQDCNAKYNSNSINTTLKQFFKNLLRNPTDNQFFTILHSEHGFNVEEIFSDVIDSGLLYRCSTESYYLIQTEASRLWIEISNGVFQIRDFRHVKKLVIDYIERDELIYISGADKFCGNNDRNIVVHSISANMNFDLNGFFKQWSSNSREISNFHYFNYNESTTTKAEEMFADLDFSVIGRDQAKASKCILKPSESQIIQCFRHNKFYTLFNGKKSLLIRINGNDVFAKEVENAEQELLSWASMLYKHDSF